MRARPLAFATMIALAGGCGGDGPLSRWTPTQTPHEQYADALRSANLDGYALGTAWLAAADAALVNPETVTLPFREAGYLDPAAPSAIAWRFDLPRGRVLDIDVTFEPTGSELSAPPAQGRPPAKLFVDLFLVGERGADRLASADEGSTTLRHTARRDGTYLLRLQPELLVGGRYSIVQRTEASLRFPVEGANEGNIQSLFGDARDGGSRDHHGVDIFARRGAPVVAAADGVVRRVDTTEIGGRVVWLSDTEHGQSIYYAHLDDWATESGRQVRKGDVLGYVGNTGNARTTPPHLHFGIYSRGPVDPLPFIRAADRPPPAPAGALALLGGWGRIARARVPMRAAPARGSDTLATLEAGTALRVAAASSHLFRVALPDGRVGYVEARAIARLSAPLRSRALAAGDALLSAPSERGVIVEVVPAAARAGVLARFGGFALVDVNGRRGWVREGT